jgi:hypothetical protein
MVTQGDIMRCTTLSLLTIVLATTTASALDAQVVELGKNKRTNLTPAERTFAESYLTAVTGPDIERYKVLLHPATRACMGNKDNAEFFSALFKDRVNRTTVSPKLAVEDLAPGFPMFDLLGKQGYIYPVRPTRAFDIELEASGKRSVTIMAFSIFESGHWYEVLPCPTAKVLADMKENKKKDEIENAKARDLAAKLKDPLRAEMLALIKQGLTIHAGKRYADSMHVDLTTGYRVAKILEDKK